MAKSFKQKAKETNKISLIDNLGTELYFNAMLHADCMVGNSSSGIIEAPFFSLPVVNVGDRQKGRERALNVIDVNCNSNEIENAINYAISNDFNLLGSLNNLCCKSVLEYVYISILSYFESVLFLSLVI